MRLVLDTNVWLDWLVFDDPGIHPLRAAVTAGRGEVVIDVPCLEELGRVLAYPLLADRLSAEARQACLAEVRRMAYVLDTAPPASAPLPALPRCSDADDQKFLELAQRCGADVLVTKDRALLDIGRRHGRRLAFRIAAPARLGL